LSLFCLEILIDKKVEKFSIINYFKVSVLGRNLQEKHARKIDQMAKKCNQRRNIPYMQEQFYMYFTRTNHTQNMQDVPKLNNTRLQMERTKLCRKILYHFAIFAIVNKLLIIKNHINSTI